MNVVVVAVALVVFGSIAKAIGHADHANRNFLLGFFLGPLGILIVAVLKVSDQAESEASNT